MVDGIIAIISNACPQIRDPGNRLRLKLVRLYVSFRDGPLEKVSGGGGGGGRCTKKKVHARENEVKKKFMPAN